MIRDQLLERVLGYHEEMWAGIFDQCAGFGGSLATHLRAIVTDFLGALDGENGQTLVRVHADQDWSADLGENVALLLEALLDVVEDGLLAEIVEGE